MLPAEFQCGIQEGECLAVRAIPSCQQECDHSQPTEDLEAPRDLLLLKNQVWQPFPLLAVSSHMDPGNVISQTDEFCRHS